MGKPIQVREVPEHFSSDRLASKPCEVINAGAVNQLIRYVNKLNRRINKLEKKSL